LISIRPLKLLMLPLNVIAKNRMIFYGVECSHFGRILPT
jgi:hypothetical protein